MSVELSVCGLYVIPGREQQGWECGLYPVTVESVDLSVALNFARLEVTREAEANGLAGSSFIAASFHPGKVDKCPGLEYADQPVNINEERDRFGGGRLRVYTVCGFYADNWQTYSTYVDAISPRMAYYQAWEDVQQTEGRYLYVANVHEGTIERCPVPGTDEAPAFGDPSVTTPEEMGAELELLTGGEVHP